MIGRTNTGGGGGGGGMNFRILDGTSAPNSPKANDIWLNTNTKIPGWYFTPTEPNVETLTRRGSDWDWKIQRTLKDGDILNFTIPTTVATSYGSLEVTDGTGKMFFIRDYSGGILSAWQGGYKVGLIISGNQARLYTQGGYYHKEGLAWITVGTTSPVAFNALKKNGITVFPISAKQWVNGAWFDVEAKSYQNGEWAEWIPEGALYYNGDEFADITGGWALSTIYNNNYGNHGDTLVKNQDSMVFESHFRAGIGFACGFLRPNKKINLRDVSSLELAVEYVEIDDATMPILLCAKNTDSIHNQDIAASVELTAGAQQTFTLDVSGLTGSYYIGLGFHNNSGGKVEVLQFVAK